VWAGISDKFTGRTVASNGYVLIRAPGHPMADKRGYVYEHRLVASRMLGRLLLSNEQVHHKDGDTKNNAPENLEVVQSMAHHKVHHRRGGKVRQMPGEPNQDVECACGCGQHFAKYDDIGRTRLYVPGHNDHPAETAKAILAALSSGPKSKAELIQFVGKGKQAAAVCVSKLKRQGKIRQVRHGVWELMG